MIVLVSCKGCRIIQVKYLLVTLGDVYSTTPYVYKKGIFHQTLT